MWRCPNCGESVDDKFDACWNCGTARDGTPDLDFHAEAGDPSVPDRGPDPEPAPRSPEVIEADRILHERIVELCSAANVIEADGLCELLDEAGIRARVVGDGLGAAAGCLPLGEATSPRIWVYETDADRARQVIDHWRKQEEKQEDSPPAEPIESDEPSPIELPGEPADAPLPSDVRYRFLSQGFFVAGVACVAAGAIWAWQNWTTRSVYSVEAEARIVSLGRPHGEFVFLPPRDRNLPLQPPVADGLSVQYSFDATYAYVVKGKSYDACLPVSGVGNVPRHIAIRYRPADPAEHIVGPVAPPWIILLFSFAIAAILSLVGWEFR
jgi:hypothetical protein